MNGECAVYKRKISTTPGKGDQDLEEVLTDTVLKLEEIDTDLYRQVLHVCLQGPATIKVKISVLVSPNFPKCTAGKNLKSR